MARRKNKNPLEFTPSNARRYVEEVSRTFGAPHSRHRNDKGRYKKDPSNPFE